MHAAILKELFRKIVFPYFANNNEKEMG